MVTGAGSVLVKTGLNILVIPVLLAHLGLDVFGLYMLLIGLLEISMLLDLGLTDATITLLGGPAQAQGNSRAYLKVAQSMFGLLALLLLGAGLAVSPWFSEWFHISDALAPMARLAFLLMAVEIFLTMIGCYFQAVLMAHCSHQWVNVSETLYYLISNVGALLLLFAGFGLPAVLTLRLVAAVLRLILMMVQTVKVEPFALLPKAPFQKPVFREFTNLGFHAMMINLGIIISHKIDVVVIALFLPLRFVGIYEIVFRFLGITIQICLKLSQMAYPLFARMAAMAQPDEARRKASL